ncbi:signal transducer and transcription activator-like [Contarinia nasturtii]|uniref:signal transducer and transcription activator-like n=1 Tax=Contarinia nasturtii TaxID=265458 RepID=UPI0012D480B5|nr:signal transducer and transcription activator-like [Contarinia nasturtii]
MKLIQNHLRNQWQAGLIIGFIAREEAEQLLLKCTPGTFLLRFPESVIGGVSVTSVQKNDEGQLEVCMYEPLCREDLDRRRTKFSDVIQQSSKWTHLYPNIPKEIAFSDDFSCDPRIESSFY